MPLPPPDAPREPLHTRSIRVDAYARPDGLWDLDAELIDVKAYDFTRDSGAVHKAGDPVHHMRLRVTFDAQFTITAAVAVYEAAPFNEHCSSIAPAYGDLVGMNLIKGFRRAVKERYARTAGCTHISELCSVLPTAAIQALAGNRREQSALPNQGNRRPFELEGCHALRLDGPVTEKFYPMWYQAPPAATRRE